MQLKLLPFSAHLQQEGGRAWLLTPFLPFKLVYYTLHGGRADAGVVQPHVLEPDVDSKEEEAELQVKAPEWKV